MQDLKLSQMKYEIEACKRSLNFIAYENIHFMGRLSQIVENDSEKNMLAEIKNYLNKAGVHDELIKLLKNDILKIDNQLAKINGGLDEVEDIKPLLQLLQSNILITEMQFIKLYSDFNNFFLGA